MVSVLLKITQCWKGRNSQVPHIFSEKKRKPFSKLLRKSNGDGGWGAERDTLFLLFFFFFIYNGNILSSILGLPVCVYHTLRGVFTLSSSSPVWAFGEVDDCVPKCPTSVYEWGDRPYNWTSRPRGPDYHVGSGKPKSTRAVSRESGFTFFLPTMYHTNVERGKHGILENGVSAPNMEKTVSGGSSCYYDRWDLHGNMDISPYFSAVFRFFPFPFSLFPARHPPSHFHSARVIIKWRISTLSVCFALMVFPSLVGCLMHLTPLKIKGKFFSLNNMGGLYQPPTLSELTRTNIHQLFLLFLHSTPDNWQMGFPR